MTTATIDPQLHQAMAARRSEEFQLLLRVDCVDADREQTLVTRGVTIRRSIKLVPTFAVSCRGEVGLGLLELAWIRHVEEDRPVYAL